MNSTWRDVFEIVILLIVGLAGSPISQLVKNLLTKLLNKPVEGRLALIITGIIALGLAVLEKWLSGVLVFSEITLENFPGVFGLVFTAATFYYHLFKESNTVLGKNGLLKPVQ